MLSTRLTIHRNVRALVPSEVTMDELCNALNLLWHHGFTGTPPSLMGVNTADQAYQWVDDALCITEQSAVVEVGSSKSQKVLGYTRKGENVWEYSEAALNLIAKYKSLFPEVIQKLGYSLGHDITSADDFFPIDLNGRISAIRAWVKEKGVQDFEKAIAQIELITKKFLVNQNPENMQQAIIKNVPRNAILMPAHAIEQLREQKFLLGNRVKMVSDSGMVPISARGTVLSITNKMVEVVFDGPFIGRTSLNNC
ncbi:hypothetical protein BY996DRAFT_6414464 [Phakopsora pachyrhizi]|nr:hypothetical protein BY996DRAFT_6414464 [Phakopsora pachyrhizi]